jgi:ATPase subunit of ABC transporter with duplicated ATPase domains
VSKGIFNLVGLKKAYGLKVVLDDIHLTFLEGARIGMVGHNGAGKTTLLRIIAGEDKAFEGEAYPVSDLTIGYVPQEPVLDPDTTVQEQLEEAVAPIRQLVQGYEDLATQMAEPLDDDAMQRVMNKMAERDRRQGCLGTRPATSAGLTRARPARPGRQHRPAFGRRDASRRLVQGAHLAP